MTRIVRLNFGLMMALTAVACGGERTIESPTAPTRELFPGVVVVPGTSAITGTVSERTPQGIRPLAGANVSAWVDQGTSGYSYMFANGPTLTDADGGFVLHRLSNTSIVTPQAWKQGYVQQCAAGPMRPGSGSSVDIELVPREDVSASPTSLPPPQPGTRFVSGVVYAMGPAGKQPVAGAFVAYEPIMDFPAAVTYSDRDGRYLLCGLPEGSQVDIGAAANSRVAYIVVHPGQTTGADIVLP